MIKNKNNPVEIVAARRDDPAMGKWLHFFMTLEGIGGEYLEDVAKHAGVFNANIIKGSPKLRAQGLTRVDWQHGGLDVPIEGALLLVDDAERPVLDAARVLVREFVEPPLPFDAVA